MTKEIKWVVDDLELKAGGVRFVVGMGGVFWGNAIASCHIATGQK